jgi:hypothetical protein
MQATHQVDRLLCVVARLLRNRQTRLNKKAGIKEPGEAEGAAGQARE